jgi:hypothetical protein
MIIKASEKGQALILITLAAVGLFGFAALAIDGTMAFSDRRHSQNASDTAAYAAALAKVRNSDPTVWKQAGTDRAITNGYDESDGVTKVYVHSCDELASHTVLTDEGFELTCEGLPEDADPSEYVHVYIKSVVKLYFARIIGRQQIINHTDAVVRVTPSYYGEMFSGNAVVGLSPHDCKAVKYQGNADTTIDGGGIFVMSDCPDAAFFNNSNAAELTAPSLCAVGGIDYNPGALNVPSIEAGCTPPPSITEPDPTCSGNAVITGNSLSPGNWVGQFPPAGVDTLQPGIYCVDGDFRMNGGDSLTGSRVVIRMDDGVVSWNGGATVNLSAPVSGAFAGLLLYMPSSTNCSTITLNGNSGSTIVGTVLAPCANITIDGTGDSGINGQIIGYTVDLSGTSAVNIHYNDSQNYDTLTPPNLQPTE